MQGRVLVCEDERFVRFALAEHLRECGYDVFEAEDGIKAMELIERSKPDIVLLDLRMPRADGFSVINDLKRMGNDVPVLVISGVGQSNEKNMAAILGVNGFIKKPFRLDEIDQMVKNVLSFA
jgi:two-component system response regulator MprA